MAMCETTATTSERVACAETSCERHVACISVGAGKDWVNLAALSFSSFSWGVLKREGGSRSDTENLVFQ